MLNKQSKIYIAGASGLLGSAIVKTLKKNNYDNLITDRVDLTKNKETSKFFKSRKPEYVFSCAAKVGGINANNMQRTSFLLNNLKIQNNIITSCFDNKVKKLLFMGSSCIYPRLCPQPIKEEYLMSGKLEMTNSPYAMAKLCGIELCDCFNKEFGTNYIAAMPCNLYGYNDNYDLNFSHVIPGMIHKFYNAVKNNQKTITLWGTGSPRREFLFVDDCAEACLFLMKKYNEKGVINIGYGEDITIKELAFLLKKVSKFNGDIIWDNSYPDGTPQKLLNIDKIKKLGWYPKYDLFEYIEKTYKYYRDNNEILRRNI